MSIQMVMNDIELSEPIVQTLIHDYLDNLSKRKTKLSKELRVRLAEDPLSYSIARGAVADALIFSTLAATGSQSDFENALRDIEEIDDPDLSKLRQDIFDISLKTAAETIGLELTKEMNFGNKSSAFKLATSSYHRN